MDGLLTLLLLAVFFFVIMRFGCGAHMMNGGHGKDKNQNNIKKHIDPVCGMEVPVDKGYGKMHEGNLYRFCSRECLDKFELEPEQYLIKSEHHDKSHHEGGAT